MYFQDLILALQKFWSRQGCILAQPYDIEKGAATFSPLTFLRSLGPEPFNAAYAEPCRRPADGRYGENPIRMQHYYQFQVVMKPSPDDYIDLYIESLAFIGIHPEDHDIRFVHDDWESPTLGAWGLGWEVWIDGMEVTQFTYFQQVGGFDLSPIMGEITYGLERLCMFLQNIDDVYKLAYNAHTNYGDLFRQNEIQFSKHNFEFADISLHLEQFKKYESECCKLCEVKTPIPALDYCLKASHSFNLLDARGAISVSERQGFILRVRKLARLVAESWLENRKELGFPLIKDGNSLSETQIRGSVPSIPKIQNVRTKSDPSPVPNISSRIPLLVEIGVEEMPARVFNPLLTLLPPLIEKFFGGLGLDIEAPRIFVTPRRITITIDSVLEYQPAQLDKIKGPPLNISRGENGKWQKPALGFAKKNSVNLSDLITEELNGTKYIFAQIKHEGASASELISELIPKFIGEIPWYKTMRWGARTEKFVRPIKSLVVLLGKSVVETCFAGIQSTKNSCGHRFLSSKPFPVEANRKKYQATLRKAFVLVDQDERKREIRKSLEEVAGEAGLVWHEDEKLLSEVSYLLEYPFPILCSFDEKYLQIPEIVIISEMKEHQKYFPLHTPGGKLSNYFVSISNMKCRDFNIIRNGYEKVLRSRFADAEFFLKEDLKTSLSEKVNKLSKAIFQEKLGTVLDKVERIKSLSMYIATSLKVSSEKSDIVHQIAHLCKADLTTHMVAEFPDLQGEMGRYYALKQGLPRSIANGLLEHYWPKTINDTLSSTNEAAIVGIADRIDTIVGIFLIGKGPTGSADPYAVRRACLTTLSTILNKQFRLNLKDLITKSMESYGNLTGKNDENDPREKIIEFFLNRTIGCIQDGNFAEILGDYSADLVKSVIHSSTGWYDLVDLMNRMDAMRQFQKREDFYPVASTFKRVNNILRGELVSGNVDPNKFKVSEEGILWEQFMIIQESVSKELVQENYLSSLIKIAPIRNSVDRFFDAVLVNDPDDEIRTNRKCLIGKVIEIVIKIADFQYLQVESQ